jgi:hypothetical protein
MDWEVKLSTLWHARAECQSMRQSLIYLLVLALACGDGVTGPATRDMQVTLCYASPNLWLAYHNEAQGWLRVDLSSVAPPGGPIALTLKATDRMGVARAWLGSTSPTVDIFYGTAEQVRALLDCPVDPNPLRILHGDVVWGSPAYVSVGRGGGFINDYDASFYVWGVPAGARDLLANRYVEGTDSVYTDRLILRRGQSHPDDKIGLLDFESAETFAPQTNSVSWTGEAAGVYSYFLGADGNYHGLSFRYPTSVGEDAARTATVFSVPSERLRAGDKHAIHLRGENRGIVQTYQTLDNLTMAFGPMLATPTFETVASTPNLRVRANLLSQPEYDGFVVLSLSQLQPDFTGPAMDITVTREFAGDTAQTWSITVPDLSSVPGFGTWMGLDGSKPYQWSFYATNNPWSTQANAISMPFVVDPMIWAKRSGTNQ